MQTAFTWALEIIEYIHHTMEKEKLNCFVIMPFSVRDQDLQKYHNDRNHWKEVYEGLIVKSLVKAGLNYQRDDEDLKSRLITEDIWRKIENSDLILCDLSAANPNVFLELGWALRSDKRFVLIKDDMTDRFFDLNQYYTYEYSHLLQPSKLNTAIEELATVITKTINDDKKHYSIVNKVGLRTQAIAERKKGNIEIELLDQIANQVQQLTQDSNKSNYEHAKKLPINSQKIASQTQLANFLPGTTWKKVSNFEIITFLDKNNFLYKNLKDDNSFQGKYKLEMTLGKMTLIWPSDNFKAESEFFEGFSRFVEVYNPDYIWKLVG